jgi:hypothetical protein
LPKTKGKNKGKNHPRSLRVERLIRLALPTGWCVLWGLLALYPGNSTFGHVLFLLLLMVGLGWRACVVHRVQDEALIDLTPAER